MQTFEVVRMRDYRKPFLGGLWEMHLNEVIDD